MRKRGYSDGRASSLHRNVARSEVTVSRTALINTPNPAWLHDPQAFAVNRLSARSTHRSTAPSQSLDGTWEVALTSGTRVSLGSPTDAFDQGDVHSIPVPSTLETQGLWPPAYVNIQMPWDGHEDPQAPAAPSDCRVAVYRRSFNLDEAVAQTLDARGSVRVRFDGFATALYIWVDGTFIGYCEDGYTASEFDITEALSGETETHAIVVVCYEYSSASWLEDQDSWRFHGLFRSVSLVALPATHVENLAARADYDAATGEGTLTVAAHIEGALENTTIIAELSSPDGQVVWHHDGPASAQRLNLDAKLADVQPWSAESPSLYTLTLTLGDGDGGVERVTQRVGFRRFEIVDSVFTLNGQRLIFRGSNRHEFNARTGRTMSMEDMIADVKLCKQLNINAIRTSHYPNDTRFLDLCDEYGLYVIDEANLETHGSWCTPGDIPTPATAIPGSKMEWEGACVDRLESMVRQDYNHPSVLIWSLGNESFGGEVFRSMYHRSHELDPARPVHYEGMTWDREFDDTSDIESRMYALPDAIEEYLRDNPTKPYLSCEYMHSMGNSVGGLQLYTALERYPAYGGGFIWDLVDQALYHEATAGSGGEFLAYGGDFGDRPCDWEFSCDGILFADRTPKPQAQAVKALYAPVMLTPNAEEIRVNAVALPAALSDLRIRARVLADGEVAWEEMYEAVAAPGEEGAVAVGWPSDLLADTQHEIILEAALVLASDTPWCEAGHVVSVGQTIYSRPEVADTAPVGGVSFTVGRWNIGMREGDNEALLSRTAGGIVQWKRGETAMVARPPRLTTFRPLTDNDRGCGHGFDRACWTTAGAYARCVGTRVEEGPGSVVVTYEYKLAGLDEVIVPVRYELRADGTIRLTATYPGAQGFPTMPCFGVEWALPALIDHLRFYGLGPVEAYADRLDGATLGVWEASAAEGIAPYAVPQECGYHPGTRWCEVTDAEGHGLRVDAHGELGVSLLPYASAQIEQAAHWWELPAPEERAATYLRLLTAQMGVGGDDSWGSPVHDEFHVDASSTQVLDVTLSLI